MRPYYSPSSRASDINRLLDPSYTSHSPSSYSQSVYVDHHGILHDPDYRDFSPIPKRTRSPTTGPRPSWELEDDFSDNNNDDSDEDPLDDDDLIHDYSSSRRSSYQKPPPFFTLRSAPQPPPPPPTSYSYSYNYSTTPEPSPPTSFNSDNILPDDDVSLFSDEKERRCVVKRYRAARSKAADKEKVQVVQEVNEDDAIASRQDLVAPINPERDEEDPADQDLEWTPTCAQSMRRQWQAISLRFKFGVFSIQRKLRKHLPGS